MKKVWLICSMYFLNLFHEMNAQCPSFVNEFGGDGLITTDFSNQYEDRAYCSIRKTNGEIIIGGYTKVNSSVQRIAFAFYKKNGQLNTSVGNNGKLIFSLGSVPQTPQHMKWTQDNKLIVGGYIRFITNDHFLFGRFTADGLFDSSFNGYGWNGFPYNKSEIDEVRSFEIMPDGKIYAVGVVNPVYVIPSKNIILIKLTTEGKRDSTFATNGMKEIKFTNGVDDIAMCTLPMGNEMIIGGYFDDQQGDVQGFILKVTESGTIASLQTFQPKGYKTYITSMTLLSNNEILVCGFCVNGSKTYPLIFKTDAEGIVNENFGNQGYEIVENNQNSRGAKAVETDDCYFMLANTSGPFNILLYRFYKNGTIDSLFAENGVFTIDNNNKVDIGVGLHWLGNDSLLITGTSNNDFALWKLNACIETTAVEFPFNEDLRVFPNPFSDHINIQWQTTIDKIDQILITALDGNVSWILSPDDYQEGVHNIRIPTTQLCPGAYMISVQSGATKNHVKMIKVN